MTRHDFIKRLRQAVYSPGIDGIMSLLAHPPGRQPAATLIEVSHWFNRLPAKDQEHIKWIVQLAVRNTVFGVLAVLDGVRSILETGEDGSLELWFKNQSTSVLLNEEVAEYLHDIFASQVPPP